MEKSLMQEQYYGVLLSLTLLMQKTIIMHLKCCYVESWKHLPLKDACPTQQEYIFLRIIMGNSSFNVSLYSYENSRSDRGNSYRREPQRRVWIYKVRLLIYHNVSWIQCWVAKSSPYLIPHYLSFFHPFTWWTRE